VTAGRRAAASAASAALALGIGASACGGGGVTLGRKPVSGCFRAIPAAVAAVHDRRAHLVGVHELRARAAGQLLSVPLGSRVAPTREVCVIALAGPFTAGQVRGDASAGRYALVIVTDDSLRVVGARVADQVPSRFRGRALP